MFHSGSASGCPTQKNIVIVSGINKTKDIQIYLTEYDETSFINPHDISIRGLNLTLSCIIQNLKQQDLTMAVVSI
jgi:hypothetical protein